MGLKEKIQSDFVKAMKEKDLSGKMALSGLKSKITEAEKAQKNIPLDDQGILKVILSSIKQRKQSIDEYLSAGRKDLADNENLECMVLEAYLPKKMSSEEIEINSKAILLEFEGVSPSQKKIGLALKEFQNRFSGMAETKDILYFLKEIEEKK